MTLSMGRVPPSSSSEHLLETSSILSSYIFSRDISINIQHSFLCLLISEIVLRTSQIGIVGINTKMNMREMLETTNDVSDKDHLEHLIISNNSEEKLFFTGVDSLQAVYQVQIRRGVHKYGCCFNQSLYSTLYSLLPLLHLLAEHLPLGRVKKKSIVK